MSKKKGAKKGPADAGGSVNQELKVAIMGLQLEVASLKSRLATSKDEYNRYKQIAERQLKDNVKQSEEHKGMMKYAEDEVLNLSKRGTKYKIKQEQLLNDYNKLQKQKETEISAIDLDRKLKIQTKDKEYKELEMKYNKIKDHEITMQNLRKEITQLKQTIQDQQKQFQKQLSAKEQEKVTKVAGIQQQMLDKISKTKTSLMKLKTDQLDTTTKLTVLQNHQLTTELEYQSKQTENLLFKHAQAQEQVNSLKRDIEIHKQVEAELARRSHFCQKLIKKLSTKIKDLEEEADKRESTNDNGGKIDKSKKDKKDNDLISFLEKSLESAEKKIAKLQNDYDILKNEYDFIQTKQDSQHTKYKTIAQLLTDNLDNLNSGKMSSALQEIQGVDSLNLQLIKDKNIQDLDIKTKVSLLNVLLNQVKGQFNKQNLAETQENLHALKSSNLFHHGQTSTDIDGGQLTLPRINKKSSLYSINENRGQKYKNYDFPVSVNTRGPKTSKKKWKNKKYRKY